MRLALVKLQSLVARSVGSLFVASAFVPLASYHFVGEANIVGLLWNFMLPTGWFSLAAGIFLLLHNRIGLNGKRLGYTILAASLFLLVLFLLEDIDYFLSLWHGVSGDYDLEGMILGPVSIGLGLIGVSVGALLITTQQPPQNMTRR